MSDQVYVELSIEQKKAIAAITGIEQKIDTFSKKADKGFSKAGNAFGVFAGTLAARAVEKGIQLIISGLTEVVEQSIEFDKALREINTILPNNAKLTNAVTLALTELSTQFATTQAEQAKAYYQIISAGVTDTAASMEVLTAANDLSLGGMSDLETTITAITKVMSNYGSEAGSAADISDVLFKAVQLGQTRVEELSASMPAILAQAQSLGIKFTETAAALTTLTTRLGSTAEATIGLKGILSGLIANETRVNQVIGEGTLKSKGLSESLKMLIKSTGSTAELQKVLGGNVRLTNAVLAFQADNFKSLDANILEFNKSAGAAEKAAEEMRNSLDFQWKRFTQGIINAAGALFNSLKPALSTTLKLMSDLVGFNNDSNDALDKLFGKLNKAENGLDRLNKLREQVKNGGKAQLAFLDERIAKREAEIKSIKDEIDAIELLQKKGASAARGSIATGGKVVTGGDAGNDPKVAREREVNAALMAVSQEHAQAMEEQRVAKELLADENAESRLNKLKEQVGAEEAVKLEAQRRVAEATQDANKRDIALRKAKAKEETAIAKATTKDILKQEEVKHASTLQMLSSSANALDSFSQLAAASGKGNFKIAKALALARVPIFIAEGIARAQALPFPTNWIQGAAVAAQGAVQLINIRKQQFAEGGIFQGSQTGDRNVAAFNGGEAFLTKQMQMNLIEQLRSGGNSGGGVVINFNAGVTVDSTDRIDELAEKISNAVAYRNVRLLASEVAA